MGIVLEYDTHVPNLLDFPNTANKKRLEFNVDYVVKQGGSTFYHHAYPFSQHKAQIHANSYV
jgi:hypothetical protein